MEGAIPLWGSSYLSLAPRGWGSICLPKKLCTYTTEVSLDAGLGEFRLG